MGSVFGMMQSLDGYIDVASGSLQLPPPGPLLSGISLIGSVAWTAFSSADACMVMRYWNEDRPAWDEIEHDFAQAWRSKPKWVASRSLTSVGPNATLVQGDFGEFAANLKSERDGEIDVAGAELANVLSAAGLVDEYRLCFRPYVLGTGKPYFPGSQPPLLLMKLDAIGEDAVRLTYMPA
jgi:dihydrofolate reductase